NTFSPESLNVNEVRLLPDYVVPQPAKDVPFQLAIYGGKRTPYNDNDDRDDVRVMTSPEELNALLAINDGPPGTTILTPEEIKSGEYAAVEINIALGSGGYVPIIDSLTVNGDTLTANVAVWDNCRELGFTCDMKYWNITLLVKSAYIKGITKYETTRESVNFCTIGTKYEPLFDIGFYETCVNDCIAAMTAWRGEWSKRVSEPITPQPEPQPQMRPLSCATHDCGACHACHSWCNDEQCKICGFAAIRKAFQLNVLNLMGEIGDFPMKHIETQNGNHAFLVGYGLTDGAPTLRVGYYSYWLGSSDLGIYVYTNDGAILPLNDAYENGYLADHELFNIISPWLWTEAHY
ncbi:MAG: hypothetical protein FWG45_04775, partial [Oscillospiraceae bacterium]|nr:hypothetical protein [Oscillospiraceae bacterium]